MHRKIHNFAQWTNNQINVLCTLVTENHHRLTLKGRPDGILFYHVFGFG